MHLKLISFNISQITRQVKKWTLINRMATENVFLKYTKLIFFQYFMIEIVKITVSQLRITLLYSQMALSIKDSLWYFTLLPRHCFKRRIYYCIQRVPYTWDAKSTKRKCGNNNIKHSYCEFLQGNFFFLKTWVTHSENVSFANLDLPFSCWQGSSTINAPEVNVSR